MSNIDDRNAETDSEKNSRFNRFKEVSTGILIWGATIFGILAIGAAVYIPFFIRDLFLGTANYQNYSDLGPIGDYIGGTTVAILTAASVFLLLATILMQRREIKISQQGIDELVKQTAASVEQAEEARKEVAITNETMRKQQFESTFFSMISLHQNLVDRLKSDENEGYQVIEESLKTLHDNYIDVAHEKFKKLYIEDDYFEIFELIEYLKMHSYAHAMPVQSGIRTEVLKFYNDLDFRNIFDYQDGNRMIRDFKKYTYQNVEDVNINQAFHRFIISYEKFLSSYFNSIITIIKFVSTSEYECKDKENSTEENKVYREIFFSQLSPQEIVLIYYYSRYFPDNNWLAEELKVYNLFYPRLIGTVLLFSSRDIKNIQELLTE